MAAYPTIIKGDHKGYMKCALEEARRSTPSPSKFCVGAVLVDADDNKILSTGYSKELQPESPDDPGSTHAEHCCFIKIAQRHGVQASEIAPFLPPNTTVYVGIREPDTFIQRNEGIRRLEDAGVKVVLMDEDPGLRALILEATFAGHDKRD